MQTKIARHLPGEIIEVTIWRGRREINIEIELGEAPPANEPVSQNRDNDDNNFENLGITFRNLDKEERSELNISGGLFVEKVTPGSPAAQAGLFAFLFVVSINDQPVSTIDDFDKILRQAEPGEFLKMNVKDSRLPVDSDSRILFVEVK